MAATTDGSPTREDFRAQLPTLFLARTAVNSAHRIIYPFLPSIARGVGISLPAASGLVSLRVVAGLAAPLLGLASDHYGRRRTMEAGLLLFVLASVLLAGVGTFTAAAIAFLLYGLSKTLHTPAVVAHLGDTVPYQERARAVGILELPWAIAWFVGVPASGFLIEELGWRAPWAALIVLGLLGTWLTRTRLPPSPVPAERISLRSYSISLFASWRRLLGHRSVMALMLTGFFMVVANEMPFIVYGAWLESSFGLSLGTLGLASIAIGLAEAVAELTMALVTDRLGKRRSGLIGILALAASLALLPWLSGFGLVPALAGMVLMVLSFEFGIVSLLPLLTEVVPDARASTLSVASTAFSLGRILGAVAGGWLWHWESIAVHAYVGAGCALLGAVSLFRGVPEIEE
jgi:predicted MFS family arabinose efflux permease